MKQQRLKKVQAQLCITLGFVLLIICQESSSRVVVIVVIQEHQQKYGKMTSCSQVHVPHPRFLNIDSGTLRLD